MRPHGKARVNPNSPEAFGECDSCGIVYNLADLTWQMDWAGNRIYNKRSLRCHRCLDVPQEQLRTIILPPDPLPVVNARVTNFAYEEQTPIIMQFAGPGNPPWGAGPVLIMADQSGEIALTLQYVAGTGP
jgi:hypothetical protein